MSDKKNVLFVVPRYESYGSTGHYVMPLGILYVSSYVKRAQAARVFTLNLNHMEGGEREILSSFITTNGIDVFAVGGLSGEFRDLERMIRYAREIKPDITTVVGGGIMTADPEVTMKAMPEADYGIVGEGELTMSELLRALASGADIAGIDGLIYRKDGKLASTAPRKEIADLDSLPFPDYEGFSYGEYLAANPDMSDEGKKYSQVSVIGGRSCKYNCTFCFHPSGTTYRQRSLDSIFAEIDYLTAHYEISYIALREELFATDNLRVAEFCRRIEEYDIDWSIQLRIDSIDTELVEILKGTRCRYVFVGVESADDGVLRSMRKGITRKRIETALDMLAEAGLHSRSGVIFGDTAETFATAMSTMEWFRANSGRYRMFVDMIIAFPGSTLYRRACKSGVIPDPVRFLREGCPIVNVSGMDNGEFARLVSIVEAENHRKYDVRYYNKKVLLLTTTPNSVHEHLRDSGFALDVIDLKEGPEDAEKRTEEAMARNRPDILITYRCPYILPERLYSVPRLGSYNIHPSLLPMHAGANPWPGILADGNGACGVTLHEISDKVDAGRIVLQREYRMQEGDDMESARRKADALAAEMAIDFLNT